LEGFLISAKTKSPPAPSLNKEGNIIKKKK